MKIKEARLSGPAICPSCERFIGPLEECPYCGADSARDPVFRILKWSAIAFAAAGLVFLFAAARFRDVPVVKIGGISPLMNHAFVKVSGTVDAVPFAGRRKGQVDYLSFLIGDDSGTMRICMYREVARQVHARGMAPLKNAHIEVKGTLNVADDTNLKLIVHSAEHLRVIE